MFATNYHTGYIPETMDRVLNIERLKEDGWGTYINKLLGFGQE